jgi:hypothetical protein
MEKCQRKRKLSGCQLHREEEGVDELRGQSGFTSPFLFLVFVPLPISHPPPLCPFVAIDNPLLSSI